MAGADVGAVRVDFNPTLGLILTAQLCLHVLGGFNFNPTLGLILTGTLRSHH